MSDNDKNRKPSIYDRWAEEDRFLPKIVSRPDSNEEEQEQGDSGSK